MVCKKCGYLDLKESKLFGSSLCKICFVFAPEKLQDFQIYLSEKVDWKVLEPYRKFSNNLEIKRIQRMEKRVKEGKIVNRAAWGYVVRQGKLIQNEEASSVYNLFRTFLSKEYSLNKLADSFGLSVNGLKKVLTNRVYLGELKFMGRFYKGEHKPIISPDLFYAVQRKLENYLKK
jgi:hypothetical protein